MSNLENVILSYFGIYPNTKSKIEKICYEFNVAILTDILDEFSENLYDRNSLGNFIIGKLYDRIIDHALSYVDKEDDKVKLKGKFSTYVNSSDSHIYFDNEEIVSLDELEENVLEYVSSHFYTHTYQCVLNEEIDWKETFNCYALNAETYEFENSTTLQETVDVVIVDDDFDDRDLQELYYKRDNEERILYYLYDDMKNLIGYVRPSIDE